MGTAVDTGIDHPFRCPDCGHRLYWDDLDYGSLLVCGNPQCPNVAMPIPVWRAQEHRVGRGEDTPPPGAGLPRPVMRGLPVPYVTPVSDGRPWWRLTHGPRILECQNSWCCQVCGLPLPERAWVVLSGHGIVSDSALHQECLVIALAHCPHLTANAQDLRYAAISRTDLLVGHNQPPTTQALWREPWSVLPNTPTYDRPPAGEPDQDGSGAEPTPGS
ncbi:hypothetical protein [Saccharothrix longispora]|uniref:hypothetical protein n=1 Tax=Saccharothrix longispora TaxID=33920 RepID=UPI0028FD7A4A|nr:hypothetical protein [Saccharothrix longispora]MDU0295015.1 hypothetical protein [Saccharothrix longispora]